MRHRTLGILRVHPPLLATLVACGAPPDDTPAQVQEPRTEANVSDSAGISIVVSDAPWWRDDEVWTVDSVPQHRIGSADGDERYLFERVVAGLTLTDGRIVIADRGGPRVKMFDSTGVWLRDAGGAGSGPGEFAGLNLMVRLAGDSVFVFDWSGHRYTVFSPDLEPRRVVPLRVSAGDIGPPHIKAATASGVPILVAARPPWIEEPLEHYGQPGHMMVESGEGRFEEEVAVFPGQGRLWKTLYAASGESLLVLPTGSFEVRYVGLDGATTRIVRRSFEPRPIPDAFFDVDPGEGPTLMHPDGRALAVTLTPPDPAHYPATFPATDAIHVDSDGNLWVRHYTWDESAPAPGPFRESLRSLHSPQVFSVFRPDGQWLGEVELPAALRVLDISDHAILVLTTDELDIEYVEVYRIRKPVRGG